MSYFRKNLLLFFILVPFFFFGQGQNQHIYFSVFTADDDCALLNKEFEFFSLQDSLLVKINGSNFLSCEQTFSIPKNPGKYKLIVRAELCEPIEQLLTIDASSADSLVLKAMELKKKSRRLDEVSISGINRNFIQVQADKTTILVKDNPVLTVSSVYDAILKIPGIVPEPNGGFMVYGKSGTIYFDGIPGNLSGDDLKNLLKSLPATSIEKIEIISNPGASYDADVSGAVINLVSLFRNNKWISGTLTLNYGLDSNNKVLPSFIISGKNDKLSWQFQTGYTYYESSNHQTATNDFITFTPLQQTITDKRTQNANSYYYLKPSLNYKLNKHSNLILNYNFSQSKIKNNGYSKTYSEGIDSVDFQLYNDFKTKGNNQNNQLVLKYRNTLDTLNRVLDLTAHYSQFSQNQLVESSQNENNIADFSLINYRLNLQNIYCKADLELPFPKKKFFIQLGGKYRKLYANSNGRYNLQNASATLFSNPDYNSFLDFHYEEDNVASYLELKKDIKKLGLGAGVRLENFTLNRSTSNDQVKGNSYLNLFPSTNAIYRFNPDMNIIGSYSRKIDIPSYNQFDPNNSGYYDSYNSNAGNILLKPNFFDNLELKLSIFDYLQLSVNYSHSQTYNLDVFSVQPNSLQLVHTYKTYTNLNSMAYFFSIPIPFGIFKEGLAYFNNSIDIDKINYVYLYTERNTTSISGFTAPGSNKATWNHGLSSQIILPFEIRMNIDYYIGTKGQYQIYQITRPQSALEIVLTKDFFDKKLKTSLSFQDILNQNQFTARIGYDNLDVNYYTKNDTRIIWMKVSYSFGQFDKNEDSEPDLDGSKGSIGI